MSQTLDTLLQAYETKNTIKTSEDIPRETTQEEWELLNEHVNGNSLQAIYDYYDLKGKLDKEWIDRQMYHKFNPFA